MRTYLIFCFLLLVQNPYASGQGANVFSFIFADLPVEEYPDQITGFTEKIYMISDMGSGQAPDTTISFRGEDVDLYLISTVVCDEYSSLAYEQLIYDQEGELSHRIITRQNASKDTLIIEQKFEKETWAQYSNRRKQYVVDDQDRLTVFRETGYDSTELKNHLRVDYHADGLPQKIHLFGPLGKTVFTRRPVTDTIHFDMVMQEPSQLHAMLLLADKLDKAHHVSMYICKDKHGAYRKFVSTEGKEEDGSPSSMNVFYRNEHNQVIELVEYLRGEIFSHKKTQYTDTGKMKSIYDLVADESRSSEWYPDGRIKRAVGADADVIHAYNDERGILQRIEWAPWDYISTVVITQYKYE